MSRVTGVPVPTLKYYLREGLLPRGSVTAPNQAEYGEVHVRRLRLIRTLIEVGRLGIAQIRRVIAAIEDETMPIHHLLGVAQYALAPPEDPGDVPQDVARAREDVDRYLDEDLGWNVSPAAPGRRTLADALAALRRLGRDADPEDFRPYAEAADTIAAWEFDRRDPGLGRAEAVEWAVVGTVVYESVLVALRRLAQEHHSATRSAPRARSRRRPQAVTARRSDQSV